MVIVVCVRDGSGYPAEGFVCGFCGGVKTNSPTCFQQDTPKKQF